MSELYRTSPDTSDAPGPAAYDGYEPSYREPAQEVRSHPYQESTGTTRGDYGDLAEDEAALEGDDDGAYDDAEFDAMLAEEDRLPEPRTRQEARADTRGDTGSDPDGDELDSEYDGDLDALLAADEQLPEPRTRQEARAGTWDYDAASGSDKPATGTGDPAADYDGDLDGLLTQEENLPEPRSRQEARAGTASTENEHPDPGDASPAADTGTATEHGTPDAQPGQPEEAGPPPDHPDPPGPGNRGDASPEAARIAELEAELVQAKAELGQTKGELDQANQEIADLKAKGHEQSVPTEGTEHPPADTNEPDPIAADQDASLESREETGQGLVTKDAGLGEHTRSRHVVSSDHVAVAATMIDVYDTAAKFAAHAMLDGLTPLAATIAGATALGLARFEKRRKEKKP